MLDLDHWQEIWHALKSNKVRTFLTAFGVFWGIFMLVILLGSGNGLRNGVMDEMGGRATNSFFVWTNRTTKPYRGLPPGRSFRLNNDDYASLQENISTAKHICPRNQLGGYRGANNVTRGTESGAFDIMGDVPAIREIEGIRIVQGRFINELNIQGRRKVAVIGTGVADALFESGEDPVGDSIEIRGVYFNVVGVQEPTQSRDRGDRKGQTIYIPFSTFQSAFNQGTAIGWFAIVAGEGVAASVAEKEVLSHLAERHRIHPEDDRAFGHYNMEEDFKKMQTFFMGVGTLVWIVGLGTLLAGVIGVSNIMLVVVRERTKEIGVRRAVGATPRSIMMQVITESVVLTAAAGYLGLLLGIVLTELVSFGIEAAGIPLEAFRHPGIDLSSALQALVLLVACGVCAGLIPARRALSIKPVEALRME